MKARILTNIEIKPEWLEELQSYVDWDIDIVSTKKKLPAKYNSYFNSLWGNFDWLRKEVGNADIRCFCTSKTLLKEVGITGHLGMYDLVDGDTKLDFYIGVPVRMDKRAKINEFKYNFTWLVIHEYLHGEEQQNGTPDRVHAMEEQGRLKELLKEAKTKYNQRLTLVKLLTSLRDLLLKKKPRFFKQDWPVSQAYGVKNPYYKQTGHHIGTDVATPIGTEIIAPWDCYIFESGRSKTMGNWCGVKYGDLYYYFLHLKSTRRGAIKKGEVIGLTGDTGDSAGPHCHIEGHYQPRNISILTGDNFREYTFNAV